MAGNNYPSVICELCSCTDYGSQPVGTGTFNLCEGIGCEEAYKAYKEETGDETPLDDLF